MQESFVFTDSDSEATSNLQSSTSQAGAVVGMVKEQNNDQDNSQKLEKSDEVDSTFWFACDDFHHSRLIISAPHAGTTHAVSVYDSDGQLVNQVNLKLRDNKLLVLDLDIIAGNCSVQSGIRHGTVRIISPAGSTHELNVFCSDSEYRATENFSLSKNKAVCSPLMLGQDSNTSLLFAAADGPESTIKVRLYTGTRSPESEFKLPAYGAKSLNIETEFADFLNLNAEKPVQAYVRIISNTANDVKVRLLEKSFNMIQVDSEELE